MNADKNIGNLKFVSAFIGVHRRFQSFGEER